MEGLDQRTAGRGTDPAGTPSRTAAAQARAIRSLQRVRAPHEAAAAVAAGASEVLGGAATAVMTRRGAYAVQVVGAAGPGAPAAGAVLDGGPAARLAFGGAAGIVRGPSSYGWSGDAAWAPHEVVTPISPCERHWGALVARGGELGPEQAILALTPLAELMALALTTLEASSHLETLAATDALTGLPNRRAFDAALLRDSLRAERAGEPLSVAVLDLDRFKAVNDRHGHREGDRVLVEAARRLAGVARRSDTFARIGGEEFGWVLPGLSADGAAAAAERARRAMASARFGPAGRVTVSVGVADLATAGSPQRMIEVADLMLYRAKAEGRDLVRPEPRLPAELAVGIS